MRVTGMSAFTNGNLNRYTISILSSAAGSLTMPLPTQRDQRSDASENQGRGG